MTILAVKCNVIQHNYCSRYTNSSVCSTNLVPNTVIFLNLTVEDGTEYKLILTIPFKLNRILRCPNEAITGVFEETCTFSCNAGYELQGSNNGNCLADRIGVEEIKLGHLKALTMLGG